MMLSHRPLDPADIQQIRAFAPEFAAGRSDPMVMVGDGAVVAYADFAEIAARRFCTLGALVVAPAARRQGIGRGLIEAMVGRAFGPHQAPELRAACLGADSAGLLFLASAGFVPVSVEAMGQAALIHLIRKRPEPRLSDFLDGLEDGDVVPFRR